VGYADGGMVAFAPGGKTGNKRDAFLAQYGPIATKAGAELGVDPKLLLAQWGHETDYGTKTVGKFNLGNIKDMTGKGPKAVDSMEKSKASYRTYDSPDAFAADYVAQMKRNFPNALGAGADAEKFTAGLQKGRLGAYATDPNYEKGVKKTFASLATAAIPIGSAQAETEKTGIASVVPAAADDAASRIPGQTVRAPEAVQKKTSFMGRQADKLGLSEDTQRNISNLSNALGGAMGAGFIPRYLPKVPGGLATLGERAYEIMNPSKQMTAAQIEAMRVANQGARVAEAAKTAEMTGALPGEALTAAQAVEAANAAKLAQLPSKAEQVQNAAALRQAQEANQIATAAKVTQQAGQAAAGTAAVDEALKPTPAPAPAGGIPALVEGSKEDFRRSELEAQSKAESPIQAPAPVADAAAAAGEKPSWLTNDRALMMGLQLLAGSGKPGSGSAIRDLLSGLGTAGLGTLAQEKEERKAKASEAGELARSKAYESQGRKYAAEADILESGNKAAVQAATIAKDRMKDFANTMQGKLADQPTRDRLYNQYLLDAYNQLGITPPTAMASAGTAGTGLKLLGVRPS
jgi:hypothetical protein